MSSSQSTISGPFLRSRWMVLVIMLCARTGVGFQFIAVAALIPQLRSELHLNYTQIGLLPGMFMITGVLLSLPSRMIAARLGDRRTLLAGLVALIAGSACMGMSQTFYWALVGRLMGGIGAVFITVTAAKVLTDWFTGKEMATAMSLLGVTWPVGIALGISLLPLVNAWDSWRTAVYITAAMPALSLFLIPILPKTAPGSHERSQTKAARSSVWSIRRRELWTILAGGLAWPLMS